MKQILNRFTGAVLYEHPTDTDVRTAVLAAIVARANLSWANLSRADLSRADLLRANLSGADLSGANLSRADLSWAGLSWADLSRANLSGANLSGADLSGADLSGADLSGANLSGANLSRADLSGANLSGANLSWADLSGANLSGANLSGANLSGANLSGANLSGADLSWADLLRANLSGADLSGANLSRADLSWANGLDIDAVTPLRILLDQPGAIRAYKLVTKAGKSPIHATGKLTYTIGESYEVADADCDQWRDCGAGVNLATLAWCLENIGEAGASPRILIAEFTATDIAAIPVATDGKFRVHRCTIVGEIDLEARKAANVTKKAEATHD